MNKDLNQHDDYLTMDKVDVLIYPDSNEAAGFTWNVRGLVINGSSFANHAYGSGFYGFPTMPAATTVTIKFTNLSLDYDFDLKLASIHLYATENAMIEG